MTNDNATWGGPLADIKILDFTRVLAGPFATQILGDLGAQIYKVEPPGTGDDTRGFAPHCEGESHYFISINRSKKSLVIDLRKQEGVALVKEMIPKVDVVIENFRPGVMNKFGLSWETMSALNPRLVYCAISGFGLSGPMKDKPSFDIVTQALSGAMSVNGEMGRSPVKLGLPMGDLAGGIFGSIGTLAALNERNVTGCGRMVDVSLLDGLMGLLGYLPQMAFFTGRDPVPVGTSHPTIVPYRSYKALDGDIMIACLTEAFWVKLAGAIGHPEMGADPKFATLDGRRDHRAYIDSVIERAVAKKAVADWLTILEECDVPHAPVLSVVAALNQPHAKARDMLTTTKHATLGAIPVVGRPLKFPGAEQPPLAPPPTLGQHTAEVLQTLIGCSTERITGLRAAGVIDVIGKSALPKA
jgi:crotonobetainyl-CoA:carnitine CoA-transferase CaiB-like acyl-CoA transferase